MSQDHVVVCGLRGLGLRTVEQLHLAGVPVTVVDDAPDVRLVRLVETWGVPYLHGSSRVAETLLEAGIATARAVVCVESDDLHTLETALLARELRPDVPVVVHLANPAVGRAMAGVTGAGGILDVASLVAPSVVEVCLAAGAHPITVDGRPIVAATLTATTAGSLRSLFGDLSPLAVEPAGGGEPVICPGRDVVVQSGDTVVLLGTPDELDATGLRWGRGRLARAQTRRALRPGRSWPQGRRPDWAPGPVASLAAAMARLLDAKLRAALIGLVALVAVATTVLHLGYAERDGTRMTVLDALYFTVETVGTVGYGDFNFRDQPSWLRVFAIALMLVGATLATTVFAMLTNLLVSRRIAESLGRRRVPGFTGHTVVIGIGTVGLRVVELLHETGHDVVVVEHDESNRYLGRVRAMGVPVIVGDACIGTTLEQANLAAAGAVAVLTSDDLTNLESGLAVRDLLGARWPDVPVVLRLFDRQLARTVERSFGFTHVLSTAALAAPWFVGAALGLDVFGTFYVGRLPMLVARLGVRAGGGLDGVAMRDLGADVRVVAIRRGAAVSAVAGVGSDGVGSDGVGSDGVGSDGVGSDGAGSDLEYPPRRGSVLRGGDFAYLVGPYEEMLELVRRERADPVVTPR
jgi:Trk K+ transport system NAD-binding subunit